MKKSALSSVLICILFAVLSVGQGHAIDQAEALRRGVDSYTEGDFHNALSRFRQVLLSPAAVESHGHAYFWVAKTFTALGRYEEAAVNLEHFLKTFPSHPLYPEGYYEKGRLLFLQSDYEAALQVLQSFIEDHPRSPFIANAYYWSGEALYSLGDLDGAERLFNHVVSEFPTSFRFEAARYKKSLIDLRRREEQLLRLLRWSHEEHIRAVEEWERREKTYEEAMKAYQDRIRVLADGRAGEEIVRLGERVKVLEAELAEKTRLIEELQGGR